MRIDGGRFVRLMLAGMLAGLVIFVVFNPGLVKDEENLLRLASCQIFDFDQAMKAIEEIKKRFTTPDPFGAFMFTGMFSAMLGGMLAIVDEMSSMVKRVARKAVIATAGGIAIGGGLGMAIDFICTRLARINLLFVVLSAAFGWPLIGLAAGASVGLTLGSWKRARLAMIGGLIGGFIGGQVFEGIGSMASLVTGNGSVGRALAFPLMGALIGVSVAFVEEVGKQSWVRVLNGAKEGREYILSKPVTTLGKDELADIPLFGDPSVAKCHAHLLVRGYVASIQAVDGEVEVNGTVVQTAQLKPRDSIRIGRHLLRFHQKGELRQPIVAPQYAPPYAPPMQPAQPMPPPPPGFGPPAQTMAHPAMSPATGDLTLTAISGPHMNAGFQLVKGTSQIGRELDCAVLLGLDTLVSRRHAELTWDGARWRIKDLNSRHGVWINGVRVTEHALNVGDQIGVGQSWLRVEMI